MSYTLLITISVFSADIGENRLLHDHIFEGFGMLCYMKDTIDVALEVSVVFSCHGNYDKQKACHRFTSKRSTKHKNHSETLLLRM